MGGRQGECVVTIVQLAAGFRSFGVKLLKQPIKWAYLARMAPYGALIFLLPMVVWLLSPVGVVCYERFVLRPGLEFSRLELLAFVWRSQTIVVGGLVFGGLLLFLASLLGILRLHRPLSSLKAIPLLWFFLALGLTATHALLSPPFHAPDEPSHFAGMLRNISQGEIPEGDALDLARRGHFVEVHRNFRHRFRVENMFELGRAEWPPNVYPTDMAVRSPVVAGLWKIVYRMLPDFAHWHLLMVFRLVHALVFALCVSASWWIVSRCSLGPIGASLMLMSLMIIPALPFFAMHFSNYAPLTGVLLLGIAGVLALAWPGRRRDGWLGAILFALMFTLPVLPAIFSASAIVMVFLLPPALAFSLYSDAWGRRARLVAIPVSTSAWALLAFFLPPPVATALQGALPFIPIPIPAWLVMSVFALAIWAVGWAGYFIARRMSGLCAGRWPLVIAATVIALTLANGFFSEVPRLIYIEVNPAYPTDRYVWDVLSLFFLSIGSLRPEHALVECFWVGFGWLEKGVPAWFYGSLNILPWIALLSASVLFSRGADKSKLGFSTLRFLWAVFSVAILLVLITVIYHRGPANVHGRYLIGAYVFLISFATLFLVDALSQARSRILLLCATAFMAIASQGYALRYLVIRYFG